MMGHQVASMCSSAVRSDPVQPKSGRPARDIGVSAARAA